jgi:hypothetical protein
VEQLQSVVAVRDRRSAESEGADYLDSALVAVIDTVFVGTLRKQPLAEFYAGVQLGAPGRRPLRQRSGLRGRDKMRARCQQEAWKR